MQLVVLSGKGGTGKTSIVASFSVLMKDKILADCDVDAPNLHLILKPEVQYKEEFKGSKKAVIITEKCISCGKCKEYCRFGAIFFEDNKYQIDEVLCEGCGVCAYICPVNAINLEENISGYLFVSNTRYGKLAHAKLNIGEENSGKLVEKVRRKAKELGENIIIDGPPGIGCPVIASLSGVDKVLIVTEPTFSGLHDLKRVLKLAEHFKLETFVCINKYDINPEVAKEIEEYCKAMKIKVIGKIPYDEKVTEAMVNGKAIVEYDSEAKASKEIRKIFSSLTF
jgi:MinD superfamily P-loop ATPase